MHRLAALLSPARPQSEAWWRDGVLYQVYPRSFADAGGDGHGDLAGLRSRLPYLSALGVRGLWLNPIHPSADADWGYDVTDYTAVHPDFGTLDDVDALLHDAHAAGIHVLLDLVANHTSAEHPWFRESRASRDAARRDWYVWADPAPDGGPPNNWVSMFGGSAWTLDHATGQYYLHNFTPGQPDLNWWCPAVREEFDRILRFWFARGVDGFRLDVCQAIVKDRRLRDNPPARPDDRLNVRLRGQRPTYSMNCPEVHTVLRRWRRVCAEFAHAPILLGETNTHDLDALARYYGDGDELHMAFNFPSLGSAFTADALREVIARTEASLPDGAQPVWTVSNHDAPRVVSRWAGGDAGRTRAALLLLLCLRGTAMLYYGDELGLPDAPPVPLARARDPLALGGLPGKDSRDPCRAPMPWGDSREASWLPPYPEGTVVSAAAQTADPASTWSFVRDAITLRAARPELHRAPMRLGGDASLLVLHRGALQVVVNLGDAARTVAGEVLLGTDRALDGVVGAVTLPPGAAAVVA